MVVGASDLPGRCPHCTALIDPTRAGASGLDVRCRRCGLRVLASTPSRADAPIDPVDERHPVQADPRDSVSPWEPRHPLPPRRTRWLVASFAGALACMGLLAFATHLAFRAAQPPGPPPPRLIALDWPKPLTRDLPPPRAAPAELPPTAAIPVAPAAPPTPADTTLVPAAAPDVDPPTPSPAPPPAPPAPTPADPAPPATPSPPPSVAPTPPAPAAPAPAVAEAARVELACNRELYASTEVAAFKVEEERLKVSPAQWDAEVNARLIAPTADLLARAGQPALAKVAEMTLAADWSGAVGWLDETRPPLALRLHDVPAGTEVEIAVSVPAPALHGIVLGAQGVVTRRVVLGPNVPGVVELASANGWQVTVDASWNRDVLANLDKRTDVDLAIDVSFPADGSTEPTLWHRLSIYPTSQVQIRYPNFIGAFAHVDAGHPFLDNIAAFITQGKLAKRMKVNLGGTGDWREAFLWFRQFQSMGIRYESSAMAAAGKRFDDPIQRIRPIHKTLKERSGNCADLSVLMASALSRSMDTFIMLPPGHAFVAYVDKSLGQLVGIEATMIGSDEDRRDIGRAVQASGLLNPGTPFRAFRDGLPDDDQAVFDLFLVAMMAGTNQLDAAVAEAQAGGALAALDAQRRQLEAQLQTTPDPAAAKSLRDQIAQVSLEASWKFLKPILIPAAMQLGAEHGQPDQATLKRHEIRLKP